MTHSFSNCPLRTSSLLITNHTTQCIVTATDEILDLLGYSLTELSGQSIHSAQLDLRLSSNVTTLIPECSIKHAKGNLLQFQVCIHQDPLGGSSCLDYWLIKRISTNRLEYDQHYLNPLSILKLSPYGTIEQAQLSSTFHQPMRELIGKPIMAYVYKDDVHSLCANLSKLYTNSPGIDPLFIRWSKIPCLISTSYLQQEDSLNYDWMSFSIVPSSANARFIKPVCIVKPLQVILQQSQEIACEEDALVIHLPYFSQFVNYCKEFIQHSKLYIQDFLHYLFIQVVTTLLLKEDQQQQHEQADEGFIWHLLKSTQNVLEFTGYKSYVQTLLK